MAIANMACNITIKIGETEIKFDNYSDLLIYIDTNIQTLTEQYLKGTAPAPVIRYRITDPGLQQMKDSYEGKFQETSTKVIETSEGLGNNVITEVTTFHKKLPNAIGVTTAITTKFKYKGRDMCLKGKYFAPNEFELKIKATPLSEVEKNDKIKNAKNYLDWKADKGTFIHACLEAAILDEEMPVDNSINPLPTEVQEQMYEQALTFVKRLKKLHGEDAEFEIEFPVVSKMVSNKFKNVMSPGDPSKAEQIYGFVDLLVKDSSGQIHLYDFKSSDHDTLNKYQKHGYAAQLAVYAQILKQWGINIPNTNIHVVPIHMDVEEVDGVKNATKIEIAFPESDTKPFPSINELWNSYDKTMTISKINQWVPSLVSTSIQSLDETTTKILRQIFPPELLSTGSIVADDNKETTEDFVRSNLQNLSKNSNEYKVGYRKKIKLNRFIDESDLDDVGEVQFGYLYIQENQIDNAVKVYTALLNEAKKTAILNESKELSEIINTGSIASLDEYIDSLPGDNRKNWMRVQLIPYIKNGWTCVSNESLLANGILIFSHQDQENSRPKYDIIMLSNHHLHTQYDFTKSIKSSNKATSVAGAFFYDSEIDTKNVLSAEYGNMLLMKAMAYITSNSNFFKQGTIRSIRAWNPNSCEETYAGNKMLQNSWTTIIRGFYSIGAPEFDSDGKIIKTSEGTTKRIKTQVNGIASSYIEDGETKYIFQPDAAALLEIAIDLLYDSEKDGRLTALAELNESEYGSYEEYIEDSIMALLRSYSARGGQKSGEIVNPTEIAINEDSIAKHYVLQAWLALKGKYLNWEKDIEWVDSEVTAPAMNKSSIVRITNDVMASYMNSLRRDFVTTARVWRKALLECYKFMGKSVGTINENKFFADYFIKDKEKYILYSLSEFADKYGEDSPMYTLMEMFQKRKTPDGDIYITEMPLVKGGPLERLYSQGVIGKAWEDIKETYKLVKSPIEDEFNKPDYMVLEGDMATRIEAIESHEKGYYSFNLDYVFLHNLQQRKRKYWQRQYDPIFAAIRNSIAYMSKFQAGISSEESPIAMTEKWVEDYIKAKYNNKNIVNKSLRPWMELINKATGLASGVQLWFNTRAMFREMWTSLSIGITRTLAHEYPGITTKDYKQALQDIVFSDDKTDLDGLLYQQNAYFGMANADISGLADMMKTGRWNFWNLTSRAPYVTSSLPDLYYRNAILRAKMIADGVVDAYYIDEDGEYRYHFDKDERFKILKTGGKNLSKEDFEKYIKAIALYNETADDLNTRRELYAINEVIPERLIHIQPGDTDIPPLWDAYTDVELQGIRNYSDKLYGHYNDENKMMVQERFLGKYLMQYRTFISSRIEQNVQGAHATNVVRYRYYTDSDTGEQIYKVMNDDGTTTFKKSSEVTKEEIESGKAEIYMERIGITQQGQLASLVSGAKALIHFKENPEDFKEWWGNPLHRQLLVLFLCDNFVTALLMFLLNWAVGNKKNPKYQPLKNSGWGPRWIYGVLAGSFQDGPFINLLGQMNSLNPPVIDQLANWYNDITSVITGKENFMYVAVDNFGMTREFSHYFDLDKYNID